MNDRDGSDDILEAEALAKARALIAKMSRESLPFLDEPVSVGRGDGDNHLPNSVRLVALAFEAADARDALTSTISGRTLRRILAGDATAQESARRVIDGLVHTLAMLGREHGQSDEDIARFEREAGPLLLGAAERWDALANIVGNAVRAEHAASIALRVVAIDLGIRIAILRRMGKVGPGLGHLFEPNPLGQAIDKLVLPSLGLTIGDVQCEGADVRRGTKLWPRSTLAGWRLSGVIPEPSLLDDFAANIVAIARERGTKISDGAEVTAARTMRVARAAAAIRKRLIDSFPDGCGQRIVDDFVAAVRLVAGDAYEVFDDEGLTTGWAAGQTLVKAGELGPLTEAGSPGDDILKKMMESGVTRAQAIDLVRGLAVVGLARGEPAIVGVVKAAASESLLARGAAAPEAVALRERIAARLPVSGLRSSVERMDRDPRRVILEHVLIVGFIEAIAENAGDLRASLRAKAAECAAILPPWAERI